MSDVKTGNVINDAFMKKLEAGITKILNNKDSSKADRIGAINAGIRLAAIKHKINTANEDDGPKGFFDK